MVGNFKKDYVKRCRPNWKLAVTNDGCYCIHDNIDERVGGIYYDPKRAWDKAYEWLINQ